MSIRPSPRKRIIEIVRDIAEGVGRPLIARRLGISYDSARYWLERLASEGIIRREFAYKRVDDLYWFLSYYPVPKKMEMIQAVIAIYSLVDSTKPARPYKYRFQGFFNIDALRDSVSGEVDYNRPLTIKEIDVCLREFRARWGWKLEDTPASYTSEPIWVETSEFEFISDARGAVLESLSKIEEEVEVYWMRFADIIYYLTDEEKLEMKKYVT